MGMNMEMQIIKSMVYWGFYNCTERNKVYSRHNITTKKEMGVIWM